MTLQSGKFHTFERGKLHARSRVNAAERNSCEAENLKRLEFSERTILGVSTLKIVRAEEMGTFADQAQTGNWPRAEFPALKIETVENGSIRQ